jgi:hypothetical protein
MAWESDLEKQIAAVTPEQVKSSFVRCIDPSKLVLVAAGDLQAQSRDANGHEVVPAVSPSRKD